ncbi:MAG: heme lyase CcmF/NrfE family subunit [Gemmatimonadaceae bacterium]|nr:heme lyase CcmF/NrfE family subunit [Gemmatimonadaceae bacterium]
MTRLIGLDALWLSLAVSLFGVLLVPAAIIRRRPEWLAWTRSAVYTNFALLTLAAGAMVYGLVAHDFSISYVAQVGSRATPLLFTVISLWGALEGSILFWAWVLAFYAAAVLWVNRDREGTLVPYASAVILAVAVFFGILLVGPANPFHLVSPVPPDGPGPNPLLQNHILMAVHPPLLYLGYVGLTVPFAFAVAAMLNGEVLQDHWVVLARRWTLVAWALLSAAIIAGMWWSYEVLGWGGYWAWDPVENASFMPWLTATAYLHSVMVQERRGLLRLWTLNLVVATFVLTILGTFLTRSGIVSSVHAFTQGTIGWYFLAFIGVVLVAALVLVAGNSDRLKSEGQLGGVISRDTVFLLNNLLLTAFTFTVLVGTLFPLVAEAARGVKVSVGEPFFNRMTLPICVALLFLMGVGPALPWRGVSNDEARSRLLPPAVGAALALVIALMSGVRMPYALLAWVSAGYAIAAVLREYQRGVGGRMRARGERWLVALVRLVRGNRRRYGGFLSHIGVFVVALAIATSSALRREHEQTLRPGESMSLAGFEIRLDKVSGREEPQRAVIGAAVTILRGGAVLRRMEPRMNFYPTQQSPVPTPDVRSTPAGDLYLTLMAFRPDGTTATIKAIHEPLVPWIWIGGMIVILGALVALWPTPARATEAAA